jgi:hypothetical protein
MKKARKGNKRLIFSRSLRVFVNKWSELLKERSISKTLSFTPRSSLPMEALALIGNIKLSF